VSKRLVIIGLVFRRSLYGEVRQWHCEDVNELRELRRNANATQRDLAELLKIPVNTFRMWDSGLRRPPVHIVTQARGALAAQARQRQLLPLAELAKELGVHVPFCGNVSSN
jgi:DNA-binding XRE family transcriptional regulator